MNDRSMVSISPLNAVRREHAGTYHHASLVRPATEESSLPRGMWGAEISLETVVINTVLRQDLERDYEMGDLPQGVRDEVWRQTMLQTCRSTETNNPLSDGTVTAVITQYEPLARFTRRIYLERAQKPGLGITRRPI